MYITSTVYTINDFTVFNGNRNTNGICGASYLQEL